MSKEAIWRLRAGKKENIFLALAATTHQGHQEHYQNSKINEIKNAILNYILRPKATKMAREDVHGFSHLFENLG